jgi:adenylosuccinate lyase
VLSEPVMRALADHVGKHTAHQLVYDATLAGLDRGVDLRTALLADPRIARHLGPEQLDLCLDVQAALGAAPAFVDRVVASCAARIDS